MCDMGYLTIVFFQKLAKLLKATPKKKPHLSKNFPILVQTMTKDFKNRSLVGIEPKN
jgi:hypothetical protein